ncbi:MAG: AI-2E family transporter [Bacillota bacterium]
MARWRRGAVAALVLAAGVLGLALVVAVRPVLIPFALAVAVAYLVAPAVAALEGRGIPRGPAILAVYAALALVGAGVVLRVLPGAYAELQRLAGALPGYGEQVRAGLAALQQRFQAPGIPPGVRQGLEAAIASAEGRVNGVLAAAVENLWGYLEWAAYLLLAPFLAYYLLRDQERIKRGFTHLLPRRWRRLTLEWLAGVDEVIGGFVRGQLVLAGLVGMLAMVVAGVLGLRYAVLLGLWAAVAELIPYIGPVIGAVPAVVAGLSVSPLTGLQVAAAFALIQQLENAVLGPRVLGESVGLHPLVVFFAVLTGGYLAGVPGMVLAVPVAGVLRVTGRVLYRWLAEPPGVEEG